MVLKGKEAGLVQIIPKDIQKHCAVHSLTSHWQQSRSFLIGLTKKQERKPVKRLQENLQVIYQSLARHDNDALHSNYEFSRNTDSKGKFLSSISGNRVSITVESPRTIRRPSRKYSTTKSRLLTARSSTRRLTRKPR